MNEEIIDRLHSDLNPGALLMNGFENALIGATEDFDEVYRFVYSYRKIIAILIKEHDMDELTAIEYYDFNIARSIPYMGPNRPVILEIEADD